jgi:hypothetical protein
MKKFFLLAIFTLFLHFASRAQVCGTDGILLETQAQVNAFSTNYPGCTQVVQLEITGAGITNLDGLGVVTSILSLNIHDCPDLTTLGGLNVTTLSDLRLMNNPLLTNFSGLESVAAIGLTVINCPAITSLSGLGNVTNLGGIYLEGTGITNFTELTSLSEAGGISFVSPNPNLKNFEGFEAVTALAGGVIIGEGMVMTDFTGLDNVETMFYMDLWGKFDSFEGLGSLQSTIGWIDLYPTADIPNFKGLNSLVYAERIGSNSPNLTSLEGLETLDSTMFGVSIQNSKIQNLKGLSGMTSLSLGLSSNALLNDLTDIQNVPLKGLTIEGSPLLSNCAVKSVCEFLSNQANTATFGSNATGCNTRAEIVNSIQCQTVLPVELLSFTGKPTPEGNKLMWKTTWETGNKGFEIERSTDMRNFEKVGFVDGYGDSNTQKQYSFVDPGVARVSYYRLKQLDFGQNFHYSKIIAIHNGRQTVQVYPNPVKGDLMIEAADKNQAFSVKNMQGIIVMEGSVLPQKTLDTSALESGVYLLSVGKEVFKVMVQE